MARYGGDEFAIVLPRADAEAGRAVAERVLDAIAEPVAFAGDQLRVTGSSGIATAHCGVPESPELLRQAGAAMYAARTEATCHIRQYEPESAGDQEPTGGHLARV